jgi:hypothetical protein
MVQIMKTHSGQKNMEELADVKAYGIEIPSFQTNLPTNIIVGKLKTGITSHK